VRSPQVAQDKFFWFAGIGFAGKMGNNKKEELWHGEKRFS
jgi:hypothetical protein